VCASVTSWYAYKHTPVELSRTLKCIWLLYSKLPSISEETKTSVAYRDYLQISSLCFILSPQLCVSASLLFCSVESFMKSDSAFECEQTEKEIYLY